MKIMIAAIGRLKAGAEREIAERLLSRAKTAGKNIGLTFSTREFPESRAGSSKTRKDQEAATITAALPQKTILIALDEHGQAIDSRAFAKQLEKWRDSGVSDVIFAIGGADGHGAAILERSDMRIAFGAMTWPHQIIRLMLAEQLYRAITILSGHPYHRD
jgi:23S rRNA (pseudouridine1915-N3)-methyltransferase